MSMMPEYCEIKQLPPHLLVEAAKVAVIHNPLNQPSRLDVGVMLEKHGTGEVPTAEHLAILTKKYWSIKGVTLTVGFPFDSTPADLQARILAHMNAWSTVAHANVKFVLTTVNPQVRIARTPGGGYWSYLGTDVLSIPANQPTMNLDSFTMQTPESEYHRVVRHETGHTLGAVHEHLRAALISRLDPAKTIAFFAATQGWSAATTTAQVLTPVTESSLLRTSTADQDSIMCYRLPASITKDGMSIRGGLDINSSDALFMASIYPVTTTPPVDPGWTATVRGTGPKPNSLTISMN